MLPTESKSLSLHAPDTVAIGVTGHRFLRDVDALLPAIDRVLTDIHTRWPDLPLTILSSLAEGSDRLIAQRALDLFQARLIVPLPLPEEEYSRDFEQAGSDQEFWRLLRRATKVVRVPIAPNRPAAYAAAGEYLLVQSDILLALWDGRPAQGDGGTATVVSAARRTAHPLVWIQACNNQPGQQDSLDRGTQGKVSYENL